MSKVRTNEEVLNKNILAMDYMRNNMLQDVVNATTKKVIIKIDNATLKKMKEDKYKLCFAKKVGDFDYNVVWQAYGTYLANNVFSWTPLYSLFGSNSFQESVQVAVSSSPVSIKLGQVTTLDKYGILSKAVDGVKSTCLTLKNEYGRIHPGVNQLSAGIDGQMISTPIYVAQNAVAEGQVELTPKETVLVWFEQNIETSTMFCNAKSNSVEIDLTVDNQATYGYTDGKWYETV